MGIVKFCILDFEFSKSLKILSLWVFSNFENLEGLEILKISNFCKLNLQILKILKS
jgi:hypothetical protein